MKWNTKQTKDLFEAVLCLESLDEAKAFFRDLLTAEEIVEFSKRWQAAQMLDRGATYTEIVKKTGLSSRTVARISKWLRGGKRGYKRAIAKKQHHKGNSSGKSPD